jgi:hypothetical protein
VAPNPQYTWHRSELIDRGVSRSFRRIRRGAYAQSTNDPEENNGVKPRRPSVSKGVPAGFGLDVGSELNNSDLSGYVPGKPG